MSGIAIAGYALLAAAVLLLLVAMITSVRRRRAPVRGRPDPPAVSAAVARPARAPLPSDLAPRISSAIPDAEPRAPSAEPPPLPTASTFELAPAPTERRRAALLAGAATFAIGAALAWAVARRGKRDATRS